MPASPRQALLGSMLVLAACSVATPDAAEGDGRARSVAAAVINGEASPAAQDAVVLVYDGSSSCTGTLIAPNLVLTARHCVSPDDDGRSTCSDKGVPLEGGTVGADTPAANFVIYTGVDARRRLAGGAEPAAFGKALVHGPSLVLCNDDVAFLVLDRKVPGRTAPLRVASGAAINEMLTAVGWGLEASGSLPATRLQRKGISVTVIGPRVLNAATGSGLGDSELLTGESICSGDSGGPLFSASGALVGVVSRGGGGNISQTNDASTCVGLDATNIFTHLGKKGALVTEAFAVAGATLRTEGDRPKVGTGAACEQSFDCLSDACVGGACRADCASEDCKLTDDCTPFEDRKVCVPSGRPAVTPVASEPLVGAGAPPRDNSSGGCNVTPSPPPSQAHLAAFGATVALLLVARKRKR